MKVTTQISERDILLLTRYVVKKPPLRKQVLLNQWVPPPIVYMVGFFIFELSVVYSLMGAVITGLVIYICSDWFMRRGVRKMLLHSKGILGEHRIEINSEGLQEKTDVNEGFHHWKGIFSVEENDDYIYVFLTGSEAHIIPKNSFASDEEVKEFFRQAYTFWRESTDQRNS